MKNESSDNTTQLNAKPLKKAYSSPSLKWYGAIHLCTQGTITANGDAGNSMMAPPASDRMVKENIVKVGTHPFGIGLYLFDYNTDFVELRGLGRQFGVMADEVETVIPEAVSVHPNGYKQVNYSMLGITRSIH